MAEHPNVALVKKWYEAFLSGDYPPTIRELLAEDAVWHLPGTHPLSGEHRGREDILAAFRRFEELSRGTIQIELHDALANDEHAVALLRATGTREGRQYASLEIDVFHIRDGKVTECWSLSQDQRITDEFWS